MAWEETLMTTYMTCMLCATTMGICTEATTLVIQRTELDYKNNQEILASSSIFNPFFSFCFVLTAYCKNSIDGQWYCFDDSEVSPIADDDVCQQTAYILFYQRRTAIPSWSANSSVAGQCLCHSVCVYLLYFLSYCDEDCCECKVQFYCNVCMNKPTKV